MNIKLMHTDYLRTGIFGFMEPEDGSFLLCTLEHAFPQQSDGIQSSTVFKPIIPPGTYTCVRGIHCLKDPKDPTKLSPPFETFEITGVAGHTKLLFHKGNFNKDSEGCILLGLARDEINGILNSKQAFEKLMAAQQGVDSFTLTVY